MGSHSMYVCICTGVTDGKIREAIYEGCCSYREVREATGVASQCGKCSVMTREILDEALSETPMINGLPQFYAAA